MKGLSSSLLIISLIFIFVSLSFAQESSANKRLSDPVGGYSFIAPTGFTTNKNNEGFTLVNEAKTILIVIKSHNFNSFELFSKQANLQADGFTMVGKVQNLNDTDRAFRASKTTAQGNLIADTFASFSPYGGGSLVVTLSDKDNAETAFQTALKISKSLLFAKPPESNIAVQAQNLLKGKHLLYLYTGNGYSERQDIYLCASGSFYFRSDASSLSANGSGAVASNADGNWKISSNGGLKLILQFQNGNVREYAVTERQASNEIGLNGKRFFVQTHNVCR